MTAARRHRSTAGAFRRLEESLRDYTGGVRAGDVRRMFDRDAARAWRVLSRDRAPGEEPAKGLRRWWHRAKVLFLGISFRLTPPRRILFLVGLVAAFLSFGDSQVGVDSSQRFRFVIDASPLWSLVAFGSLLYLLVVELVDRVLVRDELEVARAVQRDLMPAAAPALAGWGFAHSYRTANEVGGDAYDFVQLDDGRLALAVSDASGHGMAAGLVTTVASATLRTAVEIDPTPAAVARLVHRALRRAAQRRSFLTLFYGLLEPGSGALTWACAGHPYPLLRRAGGGLEEIGSGALPLGARAEVAPALGAAVIEPGDLLVLYTDGLVETLGSGGTAFGHERLRAAVAPGGGAAAVHARVLAAFAAHLGDGDLEDDLSLVVVERAAPTGVGSAGEERAG